MKALAQRRARIARVRHVQHLQAADAAAVAEGKVIQLEGNAGRIATLRSGLALGVGITTGARLGASGELGARLDDVRQTLTNAIGNARSVAEARVADRLDARIAREGAERLEGRAVADLQRMIEERMAASIRHRSRTPTHG